MIKITAVFKLKDGTLDQVVELAKELIATTRKEAGCVQYELVQSTKDKNHLVMLEAWETEEAINTHSNSEHFTRIVPQIAALCAEPPVIDTFVPLV